MLPEYLFPARIVTTRSFAVSWDCKKCGEANHPVAHEIFRIPRFICTRCGFKGYCYFRITFTFLRINGLGVLPPIINQHAYPICTILAILNAMGIILRLRGAFQSIIITTILSWRDVMEKYNKALNCVFDRANQLDKAWGRMSGVLDVVKNIGVVDNGGAIYRIKNWVWFNSMSFEDAVKILADGIPLLAVARYFPHFITLGEDDVYSTRGYVAGSENEQHVIVLIGASGDSTQGVFEFMDTHGDHSQVHGIGKVYAEECYMGYGFLEWYP